MYPSVVVAAVACWVALEVEQSAWTLSGWSQPSLTWAWLARAGEAVEALADLTHTIH